MSRHPVAGTFAKLSRSNVWPAKCSYINPVWHFQVGVRSENGSLLSVKKIWIIGIAHLECWFPPTVELTCDEGRLKSSHDRWSDVTCLFLWLRFVLKSVHVLRWFQILLCWILTFVLKWILNSIIKLYSFTVQCKICSTKIYKFI